jgi:YhcH/YjgK/YiaL family protein
VILDELRHAGRYAPLHPAFARAFAFLQTAPADIADGRHEIDGDRIYANVMSYETKVPANQTHETHRRYADVQFVLRGDEVMHFTPASRLEAGNGYQEAKDFELFATVAAPSPLAVRAGQFAIFYPGEGHQPGLVAEARVPVKKIVVKVALDA